LSVVVDKRVLKKTPEVTVILHGSALITVLVAAAVEVGQSPLQQQAPEVRVAVVVLKAQATLERLVRVVRVTLVEQVLVVVLRRNVEVVAVAGLTR
jgi:hypothetical protein